MDLEHVTTVGATAAASGSLGVWLLKTLIGRHLQHLDDTLKALARVNEIQSQMLSEVATNVAVVNARLATFEDAVKSIDGLKQRVAVVEAGLLEVRKK